MPILALIPGAGGAAWYWHRLVPELAARGIQAIATELPADDPDADFITYADTCADALRDVDTDELVVVGQSLGGFTVPVLAEKLSATRTILVNAMIPIPGKTPGQWFGVTGSSAAQAESARASGRTQRDTIDPIEDFFHDVEPDILEEALAMGEPEQSEVIMAPHRPDRAGIDRSGPHSGSHLLWCARREW